MGQRQALAWFEAGHHVLLAAAALAARTGFDRHAWQLPLAIGDYLDAGGHWHELAAVARDGLDAATRLGEVGGQAAAHRVLAGAYAQLARYDLAHAHLADSLELYRRLGDQAGQAIVHRTVAWVSDLQGATPKRSATASGPWSCSRPLVTRWSRPGPSPPSAGATPTSACHREARQFCQRALTLLPERGHRLYEAGIWDNLGYVEHRSGDHVAAVACYERALAMFRDFGDRYCQATVLAHLGDARHAGGQSQAAREAWQEAVAILEALHHPYAGAVRARLRQDGEPSLAG